MKIVLKNSSLLFKSKALLAGDVILEKHCLSSGNKILIGTGSVTNANDDVNKVYVYSLIGLPIGAKITIGSGKVSKINLYNASQQSNLKRYLLTNQNYLPATSGPNKIIRTDTNTYTKDANNEVSFTPIVVTKEALTEKLMLVGDVSEPVVSIEVEDVVNSGTLEVQGTMYAENTQFSDGDGNTKSKSYSRIYKYPVVNNSYYLIYTKFNNNDGVANECTLVAFTNEEGNIISTVKYGCISYAGNPFAVYVPSGAKYMLVQGANNSDNYLDGREISTAVYEMEVVTD